MTVSEYIRRLVVPTLLLRNLINSDKLQTHGLVHPYLPGPLKWGVFIDKMKQDGYTDDERRLARPDVNQVAI